MFPPSEANQNSRILFQSCIGFVKIVFVPGWRVHIAHVSARCPVDILLISTGFLLHVGREGTARACFLFKQIFKHVHEIYLMLGCSLQGQKIQIYSLEEEVI